MKSRTIEIIDNHIKALEEELEWYQEKNREWQEKYEIDVTETKKQVNIKHNALLEYDKHCKELVEQHKTVKNENASLREQLRWHSANEIPPVDERYKDRKVSVFVLIKTWGTMIKLGYYDFEEGGWKYAKCEIVLITEMLRWMYIPDDNQGTDWTQEGE